MRLPQKMSRISAYIAEDEAFHFVRKDIPEAPPVIEHDHDYFELLMVEQGEMFHWINGVEERLLPGHVVFLRPTDRHALQAVPGIGARIINIIFRDSTAAHLVERYREDLAGRFFWLNDPFPATLRLGGPQRERAVNSMLTLSNSKRSLVRIESALIALMTFALDVGVAIHDRAPAWLVRACRMAHDPRVFRAGADGFVAAAGRSQAHVCRQARHYLGQSPTQYVNRIRVQHAAMLLANTDTDVAGIALSCGFENLSYFHRLFRDQYGITPKQFRKQRAPQAPPQGSGMDRPQPVSGAVVAASPGKAASPRDG